MPEYPSYYFYHIKGLMVPKNCKYDQMHAAINEYIDLSQGLSETLEEHYAARNWPPFEIGLHRMMKLLSRVYARWLTTEGEYILRSIAYKRIEQMTKRIMPFITETRSLSIDMQRAQASGENGVAAGAFYEMEKKLGLIHNLAAICTLIQLEDYKAAQGLIAELHERSEYGDLPAFNSFRYLMGKKEYGKVADQARVLSDRYMKTILPQPGGSQKIILAVDDRPEILASIHEALEDHHKVIFLTGNSSRACVLQAIQAGGNDFLVKPAAREMLRAKVAGYLG